ncbi:MAG: hypothetical protein ACI8P9_002083, partial [Parasphingorhabdus sp.]
MNDIDSANLPDPIDWNTQAIVERRDRYYAASQRKF